MIINGTEYKEGDICPRCTAPFRGDRKALPIMHLIKDWMSPAASGALRCRNYLWPFSETNKGK